MTKQKVSSDDTAKRLLIKARNKFENKLLDIERMWARLDKYDYRKRKLITGLTSSLISIDKSIKEWEDKLKI